MNFLAHIYLSGDDPQIKIGNFIADGIRGKKYLDYPEKIRTGILLHREIDTFTDAHQTVKKSTKRLHENYGHYSGVIVDIFYDHFLARNWSSYSNIPLDEYVKDFYEILNDHYEILPDRYKKMRPYLIRENWLYSYRTLDGISKVLDGMNRRTQNRSKMNFAILELEKYNSEFEKEFSSFFDELITFSKHKLKSLLHE
ncbi:DUF479 domain-containing protein [Leptobacterium flavescens]|uniref:DUF479 domain-containing protein n=1 Tax=Leptobacterium flavescens TaxID=472055 RepID=A0A6P0ULK4_9FLAO|nr:acyl carrier protein phosphodiesterase [Leptobacterium flavescens]NER13402.1 DUF479 domain-containing protein [Leptobacterium flavescens]